MLCYRILHHVQCHLFQVADICRELTEIKQDCDEAVLSISRGPSPPPGDYSEKEVEQMVGVPDALRALEDSLAQRQCLRAVQLLHTMRKQWKREEVFGTSEEDDVDCLFFIYARYISDRQEGEFYSVVLCVISRPHLSRGNCLRTLSVY